MEDVVLKAKIDDAATVYVSPISPEAYAEFVGDDNLGGDGGYFVMRSLIVAGSERFEVLAKASSFDAASDLFDMIVQRRAIPAYR